MRSTIRFWSDYRCNNFFYVHFHAWFSKKYLDIWVCYSEFANHFLLLWWSLKTSTDELTYLIFHKRESVTNMTFYEQCNNQCSLHYNTIWIWKIVFSFIFFLIFLFYVIKGKAALELEGVLVYGCEFACMLCVLL